MIKQKLPVRLLLLLSLITAIYVFYEVMALNSEPAEIPEGQMQLHGQVTDFSGRPLPFTWAYISDDRFQPVVRTLTNTQGNYNILLPTRHLYNIYIGSTSTFSIYNIAYVPQSKFAVLESDSETRVDFRLRPGGTIELRAYNDEGGLMRNRRFLESTENEGYATSPVNLPPLSNFAAIYNAISNWQWDQAIPALVVLPGQEYEFHINWEVPGFGKVILTLDNAGDGYVINKQSDKIVLNFNYEATRSKLASVKGDFAAMKKAGYLIPDKLPEEIDLAQSHLSTAEKYLYQQPDPDMKNAVAELNQSLKYSCLVNERLNLEQAKADIEKYRKGNITIKLIDNNGLSVSGSNIVYQQIENDFLFGANPLGKDGEYDPAYVSLLKNAGINATCITCRWGRLEPVSGIYNWDNIDSFQNLPAQIDDGFNLIGTLSMWLYRNPSVGEDFCPFYFDTMDLNQLKQNFHDHAAALSGRYAGKIDAFEINELNLPWSNALNLSIDSRIELAEAFSHGAKSSNPQGKIIVNSLALPFQTGFQDQTTFPGEPFPFLLDALMLRGVPVDIIGLEFYYAGVNNENVAQAGLDMSLVFDILDQYSRYNIPIYIEELSAPSRQLTGSYWWHRPWDEQTQAEYLEQFYTIAFSKPMVRAINWSWGVSDRESYIACGGLLDADLKPKQSYFALKRLLASWRTTGSGISDKQGELKFRGFAGNYNIEVTAHGGETTKTTLHIAEGVNKEFIIVPK